MIFLKSCNIAWPPGFLRQEKPVLILGTTIESKYLHTMMLVYYSCLFSGDQNKATKVVHVLYLDSNHSRGELIELMFYQYSMDQNLMIINS